MKKYLFFSILIVIAIFFAFSFPQLNDRPNGVDENHWVKINNDMGIVLEPGVIVKDKETFPPECKGTIMFKKDNRWHALSPSTDTKIYKKFLSN